MTSPMTRRPLLLAALALPAALALRHPALAQTVDPGRATAFIQSTGQELVAAINAMHRKAKA